MSLLVDYSYEGSVSYILIAVGYKLVAGFDAADYLNFISEVLSGLDLSLHGLVAGCDEDIGLFCIP